MITKMYIIKLRGLKLKSNKNLKKPKKIKIGILLGCLIYFIFASQISFPLIDINNNETESNVKLSLEPIRDLTGTPIYIDNTDPSNDWAIFQATYAWCMGDGSAFDPYTISQVLVGGITIKNSDVNFEIIWCDTLDSGIYLENATNGQILYNDCSGGSTGINLYDSHNNTISNNNFLGVNTGIQIISSFSNIIDNNIISGSIEGIHLYESSYVNITRNVIVDTYYYSINLDESNHIYIAHNKISYGRLDGIYMVYSDHNTIYNNTINDITHSSSSGIYLFGDYNNISENIIERCYRAGISILHNNFNIISDNIIDTTNESGIVFESCSNLSVKGNVITNVSEIGIKLENCLNFNVQGNVITNASEFGVGLINSESGDVYDNLLYNCGFNVDGDPSLMSNLNLNISNLINSKPIYFHEGVTGLNNGDVLNAGQIILYSCYFGDFSNLNLNHCTLGVALYYCDSTSLSDSDFTYNSHSGIMVKLSNDTTITNIKASNNGKGIIIETCNIITLTGSTITYNRDCGIYNMGGSNFEISENQIERNGNYGIWFKSSNFNNILDNIIIYNAIAGINLDGSRYNSISDNTVSYNCDYGIRLIDNSFSNNITKNIINSNYNTSSSEDFSTTGIGFYDCGGNIVSENTIRDHFKESIMIWSSGGIHIIKNKLYNGLRLWWSSSVTFSQNLIDAPSLLYERIHLSDTSGCTFIENEFKGVSFVLTSSDNNNFIGNVLSDPYIAFNFLRSSYNKVINNTIYRALQCFREDDDCLGNEFIGNYCQEGIDLQLDIIGTLIGIIAVAGVTVFMYLKRRKYIR